MSILVVSAEPTCVIINHLPGVFSLTSCRGLSLVLMTMYVCFNTLRILAWLLIITRSHNYAICTSRWRTTSTQSYNYRADYSLYAIESEGMGSPLPDGAEIGQPIIERKLGDIEVMGGQFNARVRGFIDASDVGSNPPIPPPLNMLVDINQERRTVVYEVVLGREMGIEIVQGNGAAIVGQVTSGSKAEELGIKPGDIISATSATAGEQLWTHSTAEGVKSALNTRFVMSPTVTMRLERDLSTIPEDITALLQVPYQFKVQLKRPIGLHVVEGPGKAVYVQYIKPELGAARSKRLEVGDQIVAMSASWGDRMWEVNNVESFVVGVRMRTDTQLSFKIKRLVPLDVYTGKTNINKQRQERKAVSQKEADAQKVVVSGTLLDQLGSITDIGELGERWKTMRARGAPNKVLVNKIMSQALKLEDPQFAVYVFETTFGFDPNPARDLERLVDGSQGSGSSAPTGRSWSAEIPGTFLKPNNFVCTTAAKAYGRLNQADKALALLKWLEDFGETADVYFLSALVFVCAKSKRVANAEKLFWVEIPKRNLTYTVATTNSLMYMYARLNRPDDTLKVYELTKQLGLKCTVVTYGVLIKALMASGKEQLHDTSFEILRSLPDLGISPGIEVYNQFLEHYARTHNYRMTKKVLRLMSMAKPSVKPDATTYGYLITCFSDSKKPHSALAIYREMRKRRMPATAYIYMGILKSLANMRDGLSAVQVIGEMREKGIAPDKNHYSMAMFACVTSNQCNLAESIFASYVRLGEQPDTALYTLLMRALLQQGKWAEGTALFQRMLTEKDAARPNQLTLHYLVQYQILSGRFKDALETLQLLLSGPPFTYQTYQSLSFALGQYSSSTQKMQRDEQYSEARQGASYKGNMDLIGMMSDGDASEQFTKGTSFFSAGRMLVTPTPEALTFLVECIKEIGRKCGFIQVRAFAGYFLRITSLLTLASLHYPHFHH